MKYFSILVLAIFFSGCSSDESDQVDVPTQSQEISSQPSDIEVVHDIPLLIGAAKEQIDAEWGAPECPPKNSCVYGPMLEVYFVDGKAANFTLPPTDDPRRYGFEVGEPVWTNAGDKRWEVELGEGTVELSSFDSHYFYVKTKEP